MKKLLEAILGKRIIILKEGDKVKGFYLMHKVDFETIGSEQNLQIRRVTFT